MYRTFSWVFAGVTGILGLMVTACAPMTSVVMLPQPGHSSVVEVSALKQADSPQRVGEIKSETTTLLTTPYMRADVKQDSVVETQQLSAQDIRSKYSNLLSTAPLPERQYVLFFYTNDTQLTQESTQRLDEVINDALSNPSNEIICTGYADTTGSDQTNDRLSLERAQAIRKIIIAHGFDPLRVYAIGRGSRDPMVETGENTAEEKNRRVVITVR